MSSKELTTIAHIHTPFKEKFGIPRQSGMVENLISEIIFVPKYRNPDAIRGLEKFSYIWVLWEFTGFNETKWTPTVRPPRLGGNKKIGVFATRSPNRPNSIGMSSLRVIGIDISESDGPIIKVSGADMLDGTAIYDIKPYIPFTDSHPEAKFSYADEQKDYRLDVIFSNGVTNPLTEEQTLSLIQLLSLDPRPSYQNDPKRVYGLCLFGYNIKFQVSENTLQVTAIEQE